MGHDMSHNELLEPPLDPADGKLRRKGPMDASCVLRLRKKQQTMVAISARMYPHPSRKGAASPAELDAQLLSMNDMP